MRSSSPRSWAKNRGRGAAWTTSARGVCGLPASAISKRGNARAASVPSKSIRAKLRIQHFLGEDFPRKSREVAETGGEAAWKQSSQVSGILHWPEEKDKGNEGVGVKPGKTTPPG